MKKRNIETRSASGMYNTRIGIYGSTKSLFTHYNPENGDVWGEDIPDGKDENGYQMYGRWVPGDKVKWIDEQAS